MGKATSTSFKKGQSGNPSGRPKVLKDVQSLARVHTVEALQTLAKLAKTGKPDMAKIAAANSLLERGYGKPTQYLGNDPENPLTPVQFYVPANGREREVAGSPPSLTPSNGNGNGNGNGRH